LLNISNPTINLLAWKRAEDGDGTILRLQEASGQASRFNISSKYMKVDQAWSCNLLEDNQAQLPSNADGVGVSVTPFQVMTIRIRTSPRQENRP